MFGRLKLPNLPNGTQEIRYFREVRKVRYGRGVIEMTSEEARRAWSEFLDRTEAGQPVTVSYRGRPRLVAHPHARYVDYRRTVDGPQGEPVRVTSAEDAAWTTTKFIVVESGLAKDIWRRVQTWVVAGGHAIIDRHGANTAVLTPVTWAHDAAVARDAG